MQRDPGRERGGLGEDLGCGGEPREGTEESGDPEEPQRDPKKARGGLKDPREELGRR